MKNCFVYITDSNKKFIKYTKNALKYAKRFAPDVPRYVLTDSDSNEFSDATQCFNILKCIKTDMHLDETYDKHFPLIQLVKFLLFEFEFFRSFDRVVMYDPDTIILSSKVKNLFTVSLNGNFIGACYDTKQALYYKLQQTGVPINPCYYQAGLLVFDAKKIRENYDEYMAIATNMVKYIIDFKPKYVEQDAMNVYMKITEIGREYDWYYTRGVKATADIIAAHFPGIKRKKTLDKICKISKLS